MVPMAQQALKDLQVRKDRLATTDRPAQKGIEEKKAIRMIRVKKEKKVIRVKKETKAIQNPRLGRPTWHTKSQRISRLARAARPHWRRWRSYLTSDKVGQKR